MGTYKKPSTQEQALVEAMYLVLVSDGPPKMAATTLVAEYSCGLTNETFRTCEASARERYEAHAVGV